MFKTRETEQRANLWTAKQEAQAADPPANNTDAAWGHSWQPSESGEASPYGGMFDSVVQREASAPDVAAPLGADQLIPSGGRALEPVVQRKMEASLGANLSDVRIHTDDGRASAMNAEAYTVGSDIVFKSGNYDPSSQAGARRLVHELTHVMQQRAGAVAGEDIGNGVAVSDPSDSFERQAEDSADRMMGGAPPAQRFSGGGGAGGASVQRVVQREESDGSSGVWDKLKDGAKKVLGKAGRLGGVAAPVVESADGLRKLAQADSGVDRTLAAEDAIKSVAGDTVGGAVVDAKRKLFPFQGDVDASAAGQ
jgi:Domain of unknown function (DUF4157)